MTNRLHCDYGNHDIQETTATVFYEDKDNGVENLIRTCVPCYAKHILKFYPISRIADHIRKYPKIYEVEL